MTWRGLTAVMMLGVTMPALAQPVRSYSDLCSTPESGDAAGWTITIMPHRHRYRVKFGYSEGAPMQPVTTDQVRYDPNSGELRFRVRHPGGDVRFDGIAGRTELVGRLRGSAIGTDETITLMATPREQDPDHLPACAVTK